MNKKFRAVLTVYAVDNPTDVIQIRFKGLNELKTNIKVNVNPDNRHKIDNAAFTNALMNITTGLHEYTKTVGVKVILAKMMGLID